MAGTYSLSTVITTVRIEFRDCGSESGTARCTLTFYGDDSARSSIQSTYSSRSENRQAPSDFTNVSR
jgi:hypothetical protein